MAASGCQLLTGSAAEIAEQMFAMDSDIDDDSEEAGSEWEASTMNTR